MYDLNGFERDAFYCVAALSDDGDPPNGNDIRDMLADYYGQTIYDNRLYPALSTLEQKGLITAESDGRSKRYKVTRRGELEISERRRWIESHDIAALSEG